MEASVAQSVELPGFCAGGLGSIPGSRHETFKVSKPGPQPHRCALLEVPCIQCLCWGK